MPRPGTKLIGNFIGFCNGAPSKSKCAAFDRSLAKSIQIPVLKNGAIITGKNIEGHQIYSDCLTVIDFDVKNGHNLYVANIPHLCKQTMLVQTGGGGIHAYFYITDSIIKNEAHKNPRLDILKGIDIRGEGGIIFSPGCNFSDHNQPYNLLNQFPPTKITRADFDGIMSELLIPKPEPVFYNKMRQGFIDIIKGKYIVPHLKDENTGIEEFKIWNAFYREVHNSDTDINKIWAIWNADLSIQPEFDYEKAQYQVSRITPEIYEKCPTTKLYEKMFPQYKKKKENKEKKEKKKKEKLPYWYFEFETYWEETFSEEIFWIVDWVKWVKYNKKGFFEEVPEEEFKDILYKWLDSKDMESTIKKRNLTKDRIISDSYFHYKDFRGDLNIRNIKNGLLHLDNLTLHPHTNKYLSLYQANVNYLEPGSLEPTPCWDGMYEKYPIEIQKLEWYLRCILFNKMENEVSAFVVGVNRSSKGSALGVISEMFPSEMTSHQSLEKLDKEFGLGPLLGKNLNIDNEGTITRLRAEAVKYWKAIVGRDGIITVNVKHKVQVENDFNPFFFLFAMNQLYKLPPTDLAAFFVRCLVIVFSKRENNPDPTFKERLKLEVDSIFSKLMHQGYEPFIPFYERIWGKKFDIDDYTTEIKNLWYAWSDSINIVCISLFEKDDGINRMSVETVIQLVMEGLDDKGYPTPKDQQIKIQITKALKKMGIMKQKSGNDNYYRPIRLIDDTIQIPSPKKEEKKTVKWDDNELADIESEINKSTKKKPEIPEKQTLVNYTENLKRDEQELTQALTELKEEEEKEDLGDWTKDLEKTPEKKIGGSPEQSLKNREKIIEQLGNLHDIHGKTVFFPDDDIFEPLFSWMDKDGYNSAISGLSRDGIIEVSEYGIRLGSRGSPKESK